jgi:hypothetical protein
MAPAIAQAMMSHISEHLGFEYRVQIEKQLGMSLPPMQDESGEDTPMDPEVEARLAPMLAQAAQRLLQQNQAEAAQKQAQQQAQDPIIQMQMQELQIKAQAQKAKEAKDVADIELKKKQIDIEAMKAAVQVKEQKDSRNMEAIKTVAKMRQDNEEAMRTHAMEAISRAADLAQKDASNKISHAVDIHKYLNPQAKQEPKKKGK